MPTTVERRCHVLVNKLSNLFRSYLFKSSRSRSAIAGSVAMLAARAISMVFSFMTIGIIARYFSGVEFGLFAVLSSVFVLQNNLDFGLGNGLRNKLTTLACNPSLDNMGWHHFVATLYVLSLLSVVLIIALALLNPFIPWHNAFNLTDTLLIAEGKWGLLIIMSLIFINIPLSISSAGFFAYQQAYWKSMFDLLSPICGFIFVIIATFCGMSFFTVVIAYFSGFTLINLAGLIAFMQFRHWPLGRINPKKIMITIKEMSSLSIQFWYQGILAVINIYLGTLIVSQVQGLSAAGDFNIL